jgi:hypothetical protein
VSRHLRTAALMQIFDFVYEQPGWRGKRNDGVLNKRLQSGTPQPSSNVGKCAVAEWTRLEGGGRSLGPRLRFRNG